MSVAFEFDAAPTRGSRALHAAAVALAAAGFALAGWLAPRPWAAVLAAIGVPACWLTWRHGARGLSWGRLAVDPLGQACWCDAEAARSPCLRPVRIERWCATEWIVWVRLLEAGEQRRRDVLLLRGACDDRCWRGLRSWLVWLGRGPS